MSAQTLLFDLYAEWRRLTEVEGEAIGSGEWQRVERQQSLKQQLKEEIVQATERLRAEWTEVEREHQAYERRFRPIVDELIVLETRNHRLLSTRRTEARAQLNHLDRTSSNLRGLHRVYGTTAAWRWQSYS